MKLIYATVLALGMILGSAACTTAPVTQSAERGSLQTINFESLDSSETMLFMQTAEREFGWQNQGVSGGSGFMSLEVYRPQNDADTFRQITEIMILNGYNPDFIQIHSSGGSTYTVARIVEDGFRPGR